MKKTGIWMWPESIYTQGADTVMQRCKDNGITDVFLLTKGLSGKVIYHRTKQRLPILYEERDILEEALISAHARDIRLHSWFTSSNDAWYKAQNPQSGNTHIMNGKNNNVIRMSDVGYCNYMTGIVQELFATYALDGLHLDYIRFNHLCNGWSQEDKDALTLRNANVEKLMQYVNKTFFSDPPDENYIFDAYRNGDEDVLELARYRRSTVVQFANKLITAAHTHRPGLPVSAAMMPEGAYPDIAFSDLHYGQNYCDAAELYSFIIPMAYNTEYNKPAQWVVDVARGAIARGNKTIAGIQAYGKATFEQSLEAFSAIKQACEEPDESIEGACIFRYGEPACEALLTQ